MYSVACEFHCAVIPPVLPQTESDFYDVVWGGPCREATVVFSCIGWGVTALVFLVLMPLIALKGALHPCETAHCAIILWGTARKRRFSACGG
eukprot:SAG11_NODE_3395_length_2473_cov_1.835720_3_plen_92_part_00